MTYLIFIAAVQAAEPPALPVPSEPVPAQCEDSLPIVRGRVLPSSLVNEACGEVAAACSGVVVPTSQVADLIKFRTYAMTCRDLYATETAQLEHQIRILKAVPPDPVGFWATDKGQRWIGRLEGAGLILLSVGIASGIAQAF